MSLADRPYFQAHLRNPELGLHIERPLISRSVNRWFVSMSRRLAAPPGRFAGIVVAAVEPRYFGGFYKTLRLGDRDSITLFLADGTLIARNPADDAVVGTSFAASEPSQSRLPNEREGTYEAVSPVDRVERVVGYSRVADLPLVVGNVLSAVVLNLEGARRIAKEERSASSSTVRSGEPGRERNSPRSSSASRDSGS